MKTIEALEGSAFFIRSDYRADIPASFAENALGRELARVTRALVKDSLPERYYEVGVQVGLSSVDLLSAVDLAIFVKSSVDAQDGTGCDVIGQPSELPFSRHGINLLVLAYVLEYTSEPHAVLREAFETLAPEGYLVVCGFNKWSLWGMRRFFYERWRQRAAPGKLMSVGRVQDWIQLLDLDLVSAAMAFYRPLSSSNAVLKKLRFLEALGDRWWPSLGGSYVVVAKKKSLAKIGISEHRSNHKKSIPSPVTAVTSRHCRVEYKKYI